MAIFGWTVLFFVFVDEVLAVWALADWGKHQGGFWLALAAGVAAVVVWFFFASPKARYGGPLVRPVAKVVVFGAATAGLWASGHETIAIWFLVFSVAVNALALLPSIRVLVDE
jgi:hypothetical protein